MRGILGMASVRPGQTLEVEPEALPPALLTLRAAASLATPGSAPHQDSALPHPAFRSLPWLGASLHAARRSAPARSGQGSYRANDVIEGEVRLTAPDRSIEQRPTGEPRNAIRSGISDRHPEVLSGFLHGQSHADPNEHRTHPALQPLRDRSTSPQRLGQSG